MHRYFVFLRAINVGGRTIKMDHLRELLVAAGFHNVETFIASGNVILEATEHDPVAVEAHVEEHLQMSLGYAVPTIIRTPAELAAIGEYRPFTDEEFASMGTSYMVWLLKERPAEDLAGVIAGYQTPDDLFHLHEREVYWLCRTKISQTTVPTTRMERAFGTPCTMRNMNTIRRLVAKYSE